MRSSLFAIAGGASTALAAVRGFNYGSQSQTYDTFVSQFEVAAGLVGADDFTSARLYTMIQDSTSNTVISAIPAAISTKTTLLLGLWASENQAAFDNELTALKNAISQYGSEFADLVVGISVGSEDLYRNSPTGIAAGSGTGQEPSVLVDYIGQVRSAIEGTVLSAKPVGHVDTWNDFVNGSNSAVVAACDFLGLDEYPYYQTTDDNTIENAGSLFFEAYDKVAAVAGSTPIWITESGWPVSGSSEGDAVASTANAETYWQDVACELITRGINLWWYILVDSGASPSFGVTGSLSTTPLYDLSCKTNSTSSSSSSKSSTHSASSVAQATTPLSASASITVAITNPVPTAAVSGAAGNGTGEVVYVTDVTTSYVTTCPVGHTLTANGSTTVLQTPSVITTTTAVQATVTSALAGAISAGSGSVVYVTDVTTSFVTTCPVGHTLTTNGSTTVLQTPSVITSTTAVQATVTSSLVGAISAGTGALPAASGYPAGAAGASGTAGASGYAAASGTGSGSGASGLASTWVGQTTPTGPSAASASVYTGAASKLGGSAAIALGAVAAVFAL